MNKQYLSIIFIISLVPSTILSMAQVGAFAAAARTTAIACGSSFITGLNLARAAAQGAVRTVAAKVMSKQGVALATATVAPVAGVAGFGVAAAQVAAEQQAARLAAETAQATTQVVAKGFLGRSVDAVKSATSTVIDTVSPYFTVQNGLIAATVAGAAVAATKAYKYFTNDDSSMRRRALVGTGAGLVGAAVVAPVVYYREALAGYAQTVGTRVSEYVSPYANRVVELAQRNPYTAAAIGCVAGLGLIGGLAYRYFSGRNASNLRVVAPLTEQQQIAAYETAAKTQLERFATLPTGSTEQLLCGKNWQELETKAVLARNGMWGKINE